MTLCARSPAPVTKLNLQGVPHLQQEWVSRICRVSSLGQEERSTLCLLKLSTVPGAIHPSLVCERPGLVWPSQCSVRDDDCHLT